MNITVRQETPRDYPTIYEVNCTAFNRRNEARLVDRLRTSDRFIPGLSLVATIEEKIVGHILFTKINIADDKILFESLALAPMAVIPQYQNKGVGSQLIRQGLTKAKELGHKSVMVLGHEDYYPKFGFQPANKWGIKAPFNIPTNAFMAIELINNALEGVNGTVIYSEEFSFM